MMGKANKQYGPTNRGCTTFLGSLVYVFSGYRHFLAILFLVLLGVPQPLRAEERFFRPAPYSEAKIYVLGVHSNHPTHPSADYVRSHADKVIQLGVEADPGARDVIYFWDYLRWGNSKHYSKIKRRAGRLTTVIDLYDRVQPAPPQKPTFETLYCTKGFIYSDEGDYLELKPPVSTHLASFTNK